MRHTFKTTLALALAACLTLLPAAPALASPFPAPVAVSFATAVPVTAQSAIQLQGSDADGTALTFAVVAGPSHGALSNLNSSTGAVIYTPTAGYTGADSFTYKVTSGGADSTTATVTLTVTSGRTRVIDTLTNPDGTARQGKVTFFLTQVASSPSGIIPAKASVSAQLNSSGQFDVSLYPSRAVSPVQFYQAWFDDSVNRNTQLLGIYDIPASTTTISLTGHKVTDANLAAQFVFASKAEVDALTRAVAAATTAQLFPSLTSGRHVLWNGTTFANSAISESGGNVTVAGNLTVTGTLTAQVDATVSAENITGTLPNSTTTATSANTPGAIVARDGSGNFSAGAVNATSASVAGNLNVGGTITGNCSGCTGVIAAGTGGGTSSTGALTQRANSDDTGDDGILDLITTGGHTGLRMENDGKIVIYGPLNGTNLAAVVAAAGSTPTWIKITTPQTMPVGFTAPPTVTFEIVEGGSITFGNLQTFNPQGAILAPAHRQIFFNVGGSGGTLSLAGNRYVNELYPEWFGGLPGDSADDTTQIQTCINVLASAGKNAIVAFNQGVYIVAGAHQDTSLSNSQIVLPKVGTSAPMLGVYLKGAGPVNNPWNNDTGTVLKSTLTSGSGGAMIGVKNNLGVACTTASCTASNNSSNIFFAMTGVELRMPINPTHTALDISRIRNAYVVNNRIVTADFATGGMNPVLFSGTPIPDVACTLPTTATSYAIKLPYDYLTNHVVVEHLFMAGFYNFVRTGENVHADGLVMHCGERGFDVIGSTWPSDYRNIIIAGVETPIKATGVVAELAGFTDSNNKALPTFINVGIENDSINPVVNVVDDPNCYLKGEISVFYGAGVALPRNVSCQEFIIKRLERPWNFRDPFTQVTGSDLNASNMAVWELTRGVATSNDNGLPWLNFVTDQSGLSNGVGVLTMSNSRIVAANPGDPDPDKRLFQIFTSTAGTIRSALTSFWTMEEIGGIGTLQQRLILDDKGNLVNRGWDRFGNQDLTISGGVISPTKPIFTVSGAGTLTTITPPPINSLIVTDNAVCGHLIPKVAFPWDSSGNIAGSGTATVNRMMSVCYMPSEAKWYLGN